jgi:hypothetical protein
MYYPFLERSPHSFTRTHCLSDPMDPTKYNISTTPPRHNQRQPISQRHYEHILTHMARALKIVFIDHTNRNHHMELSSLSLQYRHTPPSSQLYTLYSTTLCMSHTNASPTNSSAPYPSLLLLLLLPSPSNAGCLSYSTALHVLQFFHSSRQPTSSHSPQ